MTEFEEVLETILEEYARRDTEGDFDTWEEADSFVKEKAEVLLAYANLQKESVSESIDFEQELYKAFGQIKDFTLGVAIAKRFYDMGRKHNEPVSEKKCMFTKDNYTDEDRKVLCEDCDEKCEYSKKEEPVSEPNKELAETYLAVFNKKFPILPSLNGKQLADYKNFLNKCQQIFGLKEWGIRPIQSKLFEKLSLLWAAWGVEHLQGVGRQDEKEQDIPVSEELEEAAKRYATEGDEISGLYIIDEEVDAFKAGAKWQKEKDDEEKVLIYKHGFEDCKEQMMKDAVDACVTGIRTYKEENEIDFTVMYEKGIIPYEMEQEVKLIIIKD